MAHLKRAITLPLLVFYGLGNIIGAGIYVLIGEIAKVTGYYMPISFIIASIVVLFTILSYAELASRYPLSAAEAFYVKEGLGDRLFLPHIVGFLMLFSGIVSSAAIMSGFYGYLKEIVDIGEEWTLIFTLFTLFVVAASGISLSVKVTALFTIIEISGLLLIIAAAIFTLDPDSIKLSSFLPPAEPEAWRHIFIGAFLAFYAYIGFEDIVKVSEEVIEPGKTLPKGILLTLLISTILYVAVAIAALSALPLHRLANSDSPLDEVFEALVGSSSILNYIALFAIINGALVQIIMISRLLYGMAKEGWLPKIFSKIDSRTQTPLFATLGATLAIGIAAHTFNLVTLAKLTSFAVLVVFTLTNLSLIFIKRKGGKAPFEVPGWVPVIGTALNLFLIALSL
jgi:amino acid transporter